MTITNPMDIVARQDFKLLINGELVAGASMVDVVDPSLGVAVAQSPVADKDQVEQAVEAARAAFPQWRETPIEERAAVLHGLADALEQAADDLAQIVVLEQGKLLANARADVDWAVLWVRYFADLRLDPETVRDDDEALVQIHRRPLGVVAAITPWNFPVFQAVYKIAPAILAGNTVVLKPSPTTPLNALMLGRILADMVPAGVVNVVADDGSIGPILTAHPGIDKVSFTGSTLVGKSVMRNAADTLKRTTLELGGNDAAVILDDADLDKVVPEIFSYAFLNNGQVCLGIKRIFAHSSVYERVCDEFARMADAMKLGSGMDAGSDMGPMQNAKQYAAAKRLLEVARQDGKVIAGGTVDDASGYYVRPTVVRDIDEASELVTEETFAPIRSVMSFDDDADVIARVNNTPYGLGNSVWGGDLERAARIAGQLESGTTWVNTHLALAPDVPFGGRKQSGIGFEFSREGLLQFTDVHVVHINKTR